MEMFEMGGYGSYVWSSFALSLIVVAVCVVQAQMRQRKILHEIQQQIVGNGGQQ